MFFRRDFSLGFFLAGMLFQILIGKVSFGICLGDISIRSLFGRQLPFTDCLVAYLSQSIFKIDAVSWGLSPKIFLRLGGISS